MSAKEVLIAQCPKCLAVCILSGEKTMWRKTFVVFNSSSKVFCYECKEKTNNTPTDISDNGV